MLKTEALKMLEDGHTVWQTEHAKEICEALGVPWKDDLEQTFDYEGGKGYLGNDGDKGVYGLRLGGYITNHFQLEARGFNGRGFQAREYARVISEHLGVTA